MRRALLTVIAVIALFASGQFTYGILRPSAPGPVDTVRQYARLFSQGRRTEAVERWWDMKSFLRIVFRGDLDKCTVKQQEAMDQQMRFILPRLLARSANAAAFREADFIRFQQRNVTDSVVGVRFVARLPDGHGVPSTLILKRQLDSWLIVNQRTDQDNLCGTKLHEQYTKSKLSPPRFVNALMKQISKK